MTKDLEFEGDDTPKMFVGSCQHNIPAEWYNHDDSTYLVLDRPSGLVLRVTTCETCRDSNEDEGLIMNEADIPVDDFINPFADDPAPPILRVVNTDGSTTTINVDKAVK